MKDGEQPGRVFSLSKTGQDSGAGRRPGHAGKTACPEEDSFMLDEKGDGNMSFFPSTDPADARNMGHDVQIQLWRLFRCFSQQLVIETVVPYWMLCRRYAIYLMMIKFLEFPIVIFLKIGRA
ncbi:MAG: hypothetical protein LBQ12_12320, partial [Deltaproteobacteria bacterium]|nr:hypothetical protein [Deltaproteobacteria bacterium]